MQKVHNQNKRSLWKTIGYVKQGQMSDVDQHISNDKFGLHKNDKKGYGYNSMVHHKLVLPTTPRNIQMSKDQPQCNESVSQSPQKCEQVDNGMEDEFQNVLKILKSTQEQALQQMQRNPMTRSLASIRSQPMLSNDHINKQQQNNVDQDRKHNNVRYQRVYTVQQCQNSIQQCAFQSTLKQQLASGHLIPNRKQNNLRRMLEHMFIELRSMLRQFRISCDQQRMNINQIYKSMILRWQQFLTIDYKRPQQDKNDFRVVQNCESMIQSCISNHTIRGQIINEQDRIQINRLNILIQSKQLQINNKNNQITNLQLKYNQNQTTNHLLIQRLTHQNNQLTLQLNQIQKQFDLERNAIRNKIATEKQNQQTIRTSNFSNASSQKLSLIMQIKSKDKQIGDLCNEVDQQCSTIEILVKKLKQAEEHYQKSSIGRFQAEIDQKKGQIQQLMNRISEYERSLQQMQFRMQSLKTESHMTNEENFVLQQKVVAFDAELSEKLREQRKLMNRQHALRLASLEEENLKLGQRVQYLMEENSKQKYIQNRHAKTPPPVHNRYMTMSNPMDRHSLPQQYSRNNYEDNQQHSFVSIEAQQLGNDLDLYNFKPNYMPKQTTPIADIFRYENEPTTRNQELLNNSPMDLLPKFDRVWIPSHDQTQQSPSNASHQQMFSPFYRQLNSRQIPKKQLRIPINNDRQQQTRYHYQKQPNHRRIDTGLIQPVSNQQFTQRTFNPTKHAQSGVIPALEQVQTFNGKNNLYYDAHHFQSRQSSKNRLIRPVRDNYQNPLLQQSMRHNHEQPNTDDLYMHTQKVDLSGLQAQLQNLTKQLKSELATVTRKILK